MESKLFPPAFFKRQAVVFKDLLDRSSDTKSFNAPGFRIFSPDVNFPDPFFQIPQSSCNRSFRGSRETCGTEKFSFGVRWPGFFISIGPSRPKQLMGRINLFDLTMFSAGHVC